MFRGATRTKTKTLKKGVSISRNVSLIDNYKQPVLTPNPGGQLHRNIQSTSRAYKVQVGEPPGQLQLKLI
jgi:hypothetical protein